MIRTIICLKACADPFIDDNIEMLKRLKHLKVNADILVVDNGSPHGFLNMHTLTEETQEAFVECLDLLKELVAHFLSSSQHL